MFRPPKRWVGSGGAYDLQGYRQNKDIYENLNRSAYRQIGEFSLFAQPTSQGIVPATGSLVYITQSNLNTWPTIQQLSFLNTTTMLADSIDGAISSQLFVLRCKIADSTLTFKLRGYTDIQASSIDTTTFNIDPSDISMRSNIRVVTILPQYSTSVGAPIPGAIYELYWYDPSAPAQDASPIQFIPTLGTNLSTIQNYSTLINTYNQNYSTAVTNANYSSMISSTYIEPMQIW